MPDPVASTPEIPKGLFPHQPAVPSSSTETKGHDPSKAKLPNGLVLDKDGKPCRLCTDAASWRSLTKQAKASSSTPASTTATTTTTTTTSPTANGCPPDVEELGRSTWTFLHSLTAAYPTQASTEQQTEMRSFLKLFSRLYPCWVCADDFRTWMAEPSGRNEPRLASRADFGTWMCEAHNEVNRKLGKKEFDCRFWEERWRTGWKDGRCD
ncbi:hypothetical protein ASPZODRAFT_150841 [Penicilliopsis zonata CBS 506.65]|uniref:Sulfhydryl oxidase n=1 Tax=Penicilliopsis zonata CBS 506.65 TaxID=1073090 RepID=A0A1L9SN14_9EURO|nr:hypothetical protein ASPZODRAFT_150841 [Penicilliopsis zonata CBS 506.65]OJJ48652.1 hypothetical protein ASPZODRAFT_150841 [Penicilliopsis zonata CBS 506.65]